MASVKIPSSHAMTWGEEPGRQSQSRLAVLKDNDKRFRLDASIWSDIVGYSVKGVPDGSIGDGVNDDAANILAKNTAAAAANGGFILFPPGTYKISTNLTIGSATIQPVFMPGAQLSIDSGITVTMPVPQAGDYQIISGAGSVTFSGGPTGTCNPTWFGFNTSATAAANATAWSNFMSAIPAGADVILNEGTYAVDGTATISKACRIEGYGPTTLLNFTTSANNQGIRITASDVRLSHIKVQGPQKATLDTTQNGIGADGGVVGTPLTGVMIKDVAVINWGGSGIDLEFCDNWHILDSDIRECYEFGIIAKSSNYGIIANNYVKEIIGDGVDTKSYGISCTKTTGLQATFPVCHDVSIIDNTVEDCRTWEGIDTHGGFNLTVRGNRVLDCLVGIAMVKFDATDGSERAPSYCVIEGNTIRNNHGAGELVDESDQRYAIICQGDVASSTRGIGNIVRGNTIDGFGDSAESIANIEGAIEFQYQDGIIIEGNSVKNCGRVGAQIFSCENISMSGNLIDTVVGTDADAATGSLNYTGQPSATETITVNGAIFTYIDGASTDTDIQIGGPASGNLAATLLETETVLNASTDGRVSTATYLSDGATQVDVTFDTIGTFGTLFTLATTVTGGTVTAMSQVSNVTGSCGIHIDNLSDGGASNGIIANNIFDVGAYTGVQIAGVDQLNLFFSDNDHLGSGPLYDCDGTSPGAQTASRRLDHYGDIRFSVNPPPIEDNSSHTVHVPMAGMSVNSNIVFNVQSTLQGLVPYAIPFDNYFQMVLVNETGGEINLGSTIFICYVNYNRLATEYL